MMMMIWWSGYKRTFAPPLYPRLLDTTRISGKRNRALYLTLLLIHCLIWSLWSCAFIYPSLEWYEMLPDLLAGMMGHYYSGVITKPPDKLFSYGQVQQPWMLVVSMMTVVHLCIRGGGDRIVRDALTITITTTTMYYSSTQHFQNLENPLYF